MLQQSNRAVIKTLISYAVVSNMFPMKLRRFINTINVIMKDETSIKIYNYYLLYLNMGKRQLLHIPHANKQGIETLFQRWRIVIFKLGFEYNYIVDHPHS